MHVRPRHIVGAVAALGVGIGVIQTLVDHGDVPLPAPDEAAARAAADRTLANIDWKRDNILLWASGTDVHDMRWQLREGFEDSPLAERTSFVRLEYPATGANMDQSVATGTRTLELVMDEIRRRDPDGSRYHVALQGESQGSWLVNDYVAARGGLDATQVDGMDMYGLPSMATYDHDLKSDPRVRITNHRMDPVTWRSLGSNHDALEAAGLLLGGGDGNPFSTAAHLVLNPVHTTVFLGAVGLMKATDNRALHPHVYDEEQRDAARFLLEDRATRG
jgi:hypothetical protein